jgi:pimeloyl-ACP methyl ester carboxylesterase
VTPQARAAGWALRQRVALRRGEIAYDVFGDGPPVILVHGTPTSSFLWRNVAPALAAHLRVHVYDMLGFGSSERHREQEVSIRVHAQNLAELVRHWGLERPALVGHDIGGAAVLRAHLLEGVAASRLALIPEAGHFAMEDQPDEVSRQLHEFLTAEATDSDR